MKAKVNKSNKMNKVEEAYFNSPCSIREAVQISRGVAEDVLTDYHNRTGHVQVAVSLQVELLKDLLIKAGIINEDEFKALYIQKAEEFNSMQQEAMSQVGEQVEEEEDVEGEDHHPKMSVGVDEIEVKKI